MASCFSPKENQSSKKIESIQISPSPESYKIQKKKKKSSDPMRDNTRPKEGSSTTRSTLATLPEWHVGDMSVYTPFSRWEGIWLLLTQPT